MLTVELAQQEKVPLQSTSVTTKTVPTGTVKFSGNVPSECDLVQNRPRATVLERPQRSVTSDAGSCPRWVLGKFVTNTLSTCDAEADANIPVMNEASITIVTMIPSFLFNQSPPSERWSKVALKKANSAFSSPLPNFGVSCDQNCTVLVTAREVVLWCRGQDLNLRLGRSLWGTVSPVSDVTTFSRVLSLASSS